MMIPTLTLWEVEAVVVDVEFAEEGEDEDDWAEDVVVDGEGDEPELEGNVDLFYAGVQYAAAVRRCE